MRLFQPRPALAGRGRRVAPGEGLSPLRWISKPADVAYLIGYAERLWPVLKGVSRTHGWNSRLTIHAFWPVGVTAAVVAARVRDRLGM
jgi:hypothetical protein